MKVNAPKNFDYFMSRKTPTTLLLNPDQSFCAFGYEAENKFSKMAEIENNSESDDEVKNVKKEKCSDYHYFQKLTMILHEKYVSQFYMILQRVPCFTFSRLRNF